MELRTIISPDLHPKAITCVTYHGVRRELITGCEDAVIRAWDTETGRVSLAFDGHAGWITALVYCKEIKCLVSASQDGSIIAWSNSGKILQRIQTGQAIYSLAWNARRNQIMVGQNGLVRVYQAKDDPQALAAAAGNTTNVVDVMFDTRELHLMGAKGTHNDIVNCILAAEARFFSGGYDRKIVIYESPSHGAKVHVVQTIHEAHEAGITCMTYAKDAENAWLMTGSFDRTVKLWSLDGNCLQKFDGFLDTITGICYVPPIQTLWITSNSLFPMFLDPRSGVNISDFVKADNDKAHDKMVSLFRQLQFFPDTGEVVALTGRRQVVVWRFNPAAPVTTLECSDAVDALAVTRDDPVLMFSAGVNALSQWERMQLNTFMYARENVSLHAALMQLSGATPAAIRSAAAGLAKKGARPSKQREMMMQTRSDSRLMPATAVGSPTPARRGGLQKSQSLVGAGTDSPSSSMSLLNAKLTATTMIFYEKLELLIVAFEEKRIIVWGFAQDSDEPVAPRPGAAGGDYIAQESFASRVSGLTMKFIIDDHRDAVTSLAVCHWKGVHYLISSGWDRRIFVFDLSTGLRVDVFRDASFGTGREELAADGPVLDLASRPGTATESSSSSSRTGSSPPPTAQEGGPQFAYASADKLAYVRRFSARGDQMTLVGVLQGHEAEVTKIYWAAARGQWVTGSEDKTVRFWDPHTMQCLIIANNESPVTAMCLDESVGLVITGARDRVLRVFEGDKCHQRNVGHTDEIRGVAHIPTRRQYVTSSWDGTIRIWNAIDPKRMRRDEDEKSAAAAAAAAHLALNSLENSVDAGVLDSGRRRSSGGSGSAKKSAGGGRGPLTAVSRTKADLGVAVQQMEAMFLESADFDLVVPPPPTSRRPGI
ncbi:quinon protein alcohol dehydrogenase-like superfamily [Blastocladiella britannica]|nr:quinon protein alcohol dehydrogenase-like superfamily [Blastocladiella britannica]